MNVVKPENMRLFNFHAMTVAAGSDVCRKWLWLCAVLLLALCPLPGQAKDKDADLAAEPPLVRALLNEAATLESSADNPDKIQRAATLYCKASRYGSLEAQYRLGMLYFEGKGVPKDIDYASVLFSQAAQQGHYRALVMLDEAVKLRTLKLPPCLI
ncbi:MAG: hypothetical protein PHD65_01375 [Gallionella sp.]|nr:hypothetical protein [Gallionella sp.]